MHGIKVAHHKNTAECVPVRMPVPTKVVIPMAMHLGAPCDVKVNIGDKVCVGQLIGESEQFLSSPIYSSVSGEVTAITDYLSATGIKGKCVEITTDGEQTMLADIKPPVIESQSDLIEAVHKCGLVGLGGAGFPTHIKLNPKNLDEVTTLVVNGAECEPYITCDMRLMLDKSEELLGGIKLVMKYLKLDNTVIGIEDNKPQCIEKLTKLTQSDSSVTVKKLKAKYPQGAEKVLIFETTGKVVMEGKLPADAGVIVMNVASLAKLYEYSKTGIPLIEKTITVDGTAIKNPKNVIVPIGARISDVVDFCGGYKSAARKILMGGPMMGTAVPSDDYPIIKNNNAILAFAEAQANIREETACIRCGKCARVCPVNLRPAAIDRAYRRRDTDELKKLKVNICMECGCCSYICPAKRHLAMYNKLAKQLLRQKSK